MPSSPRNALIILAIELTAVASPKLQAATAPFAPELSEAIERDPEEDAEQRQAHTPLEAEALFLLNRMRLDPQWELPLLILEARVGIAGSTAECDYALALDEMADLGPRPPVIPEARLRQAARNHADHLIWNHLDGHGEHPSGRGFTGATPQHRAHHSGYRGVVSENVYRNSYGPWNVHQGFFVDWGAGPDGLLPGRGHRHTALDARMREVGIGARPHGNHLAVVQVFGARRIEGRLAGGVIYADRNANGRFDAGEGIADVAVTSGDQSIRSDAAGVFSLTLAPGASTPITVALPQRTLTYPVDSASEPLWLTVVDPVPNEEAQVRRAIDRLAGTRPERRGTLAVETWYQHRFARIGPELRAELETVCGEGREQWRGLRDRVLRSLALDPTETCATTITAAGLPYERTALRDWFAQAEVVNRALFLTAAFLAKVRAGEPIPHRALAGLTRQLRDAARELDAPPFADCIATLQWRIDTLRRTARRPR